MEKYLQLVPVAINSKELRKLSHSPSFDVSIWKVFASRAKEPWEVSHESPTRLNLNIKASHACLFRTYWTLQTCWRSNGKSGQQKAAWRMKFSRRKSFNSIPYRLSTLDKPQTDFIISNHSKPKNFTETSPRAETKSLSGPSQPRWSSAVHTPAE